ncbi:hypothetical protein N7492_007801 [Penicillium capsulatum]|uniref:ZZ-type domain-containing protein n=1 Tax=Penicillium capsulatum TaxID=69766 RepID=A0A9W9LM10_9EURO|nr:hypothetical protein N7492_007801 [Penicillium capsulatum]KAJ6117631.1 hypothetical protein N7512_007356 [Penicillium capsulatum]
MATPALPSQPAPEQLITVKVLFDDSNRRFKLPLRDLRANVFPQKLRTLLGVSPDVNVIFERFSDSAGVYIRLDADNVAVYKQLYRAAKAKSKLRIKASTVDPSTVTAEEESTPAQPADQNVPRHNYLETVLSSPIVPTPQPEPLLPVSAPELPRMDDSAVPHLMRLRANNSLLRDFDLEQGELRFPVISHHSPRGMFCIDCNNCGRSIANEHYHCSICESGDYDICPQCVEDGASCRGESHWLIKRVVQNGIVTNSTTETIPPRQSQARESTVPQPPSKPIAAMATDATLPNNLPNTEAQNKPASLADISMDGEETLMCNGCCRAADESNVVRCNDCEDYDLCLRCLLRNKHGHHPGHTFQLGTDRNFCLKNLIMSRCLPGRQFKHAAICDGCDKHIVGTRHKCLTCPDWDFCSECHAKAPVDHPGHRFAPIYDAIGNQLHQYQVHYGIFCDGPLCKNKPAQSYISGVRYKCAICDDVDFCANCEAHPSLSHNHTHPLVKFKTPVRTVTVSTVSNDGSSGAMTLGDSGSPSQTPTTVPTREETLEEKPAVEPNPVKVEATEPEFTEPAQVTPPPALVAETDPSTSYNAYFVRDAIADGTKLPLDTTFHQTWTLYNPGPSAWPVGSDVRFVGGDAMFNVDTTHPSSVDSFRSAMESNKLSAPLAPGQSADFTVTLRTPQREGTAISYWRLKLPNGIAIGHRLWCDVQVEASSTPAIPAVEPMEFAEPVKTEFSDDSHPESSDDSHPESTSSGMIFPKLEKESPETSIHETVLPARPAPTVSSHAPTLSTASERDVLEDVESLALDSADTDAGFLTDEEYDILDASDQEFLEAKQSDH